MSMIEKSVLDLANALERLEDRIDAQLLRSDDLQQDASQTRDSIAEAKAKAAAAAQSVAKIKDELQSMLTDFETRRSA